MRDWLEAHTDLLAFVSLAAAAFCVVVLVAAPWLVALLPEDYFVGRHRQWAIGRRHSAVRLLWQIGKNLVGLVLFLVGAVMLLLPGPGIPILMIGLVLLDLPGKYRLERWLAGRKPVLGTLNWLRKQAGARPLVAPAKK